MKTSITELEQLDFYNLIKSCIYITCKKVIHTTDRFYILKLFGSHSFNFEN